LIRRSDIKHRAGFSTSGRSLLWWNLADFKLDFSSLTIIVNITFAVIVSIEETFLYTYRNMNLQFISERQNLSKSYVK